MSNSKHTVSYACGADAADGVWCMEPWFHMTISIELTFVDVVITSISLCIAIAIATCACTYEITFPSVHVHMHAGDNIAMRLWTVAETPDDSPNTQRQYTNQQELVGYCEAGQAELRLGDSRVLHLEEGSSWCIPPNTTHTYHVKRGPFRVVEATISGTPPRKH